MSADWPEFQLGERCTVKSSKRIFAYEYVDEGIPFMRSKDVIDKALGSFVDYDLYISEERFSEIKKTHGSPEKGDVLMSSVGNRSGQPYVIQDEGEFHFKDGNILWLSGFNDINPDYLAYWFKSEIGQDTLTSVMIGSAQKALTIDSIRKLWVKFPSIKYQDQAAEILKSLDTKIEINRQTNQTLENIAQAIFKSWFVDFEPTRAKIAAKQNGQDPERAAMAAISGKTKEELNQLDVQGSTNVAGAGDCMDAGGRATSGTVAESAGATSPEQQQSLKITAALFPDALVDSELGEIPEGWEVRKLGSFIKFANGKSIKASDKGKYPVYGANGIIGKTEAAKFSNAVIVGRVGAYCGAVVYSLGDFWASDNTIVASATNNGGMLPYIFYQLQLLNLNQHAGGAAQPLLNQTTLKSLEVIFSSQNLMSEYNEQVSSFLEISRSNINQNIGLEAIRDSLLPKLLSGELDTNIKDVA